VLRLYVTGMTPRSARAISAVRIFATPTRVRKGPDSEHLMIGDLSNRAHLLSRLGLHEIAA
jgi:hypothetical protein